MFLLESRQVFPFANTGGCSQEAIHQKSPHAISQLFTLSREGVVFVVLAGLRTQGHEPFGSALRGDFPAYASVLITTLVPQYRCASVPDSHRIPATINTTCSGKPRQKHYIRDSRGFQTKTHLFYCLCISLRNAPNPSPVFHTNTHCTAALQPTAAGRSLARHRDEPDQNGAPLHPCPDALGLGAR